MAFDSMLPPGRQGYRFPAEWEPHVATWLAWPHKEASWPGILERIPPIFVEMVRHLVTGEDVHINCTGAAMVADVRRQLEAAGVSLERVRLYAIPTNDAWIRDHGPIFVNGAAGQVCVKWEYNAWGEKYPPHDLDNAVPGRVAETLGLPLVNGGMVLEGGSIDGNGRGTLLTTESCLLNPNRNPQLTRMEIEARLRDYLGAPNILWLGEGIVGDDTDGHVDDLTRFVAADAVVTAVEDDPADVNYAPLQENLARLRRMRDQDGKPLTIHTLPMPEPVEFEGQRLPASYANFYIGNAVVLMPAFGGPRDEVARKALQQLFPGRRVVAIPSRDLVWGLGALHCLTQQQPAPRGSALPLPAVAPLQIP